jgi:hypothetical protein
VKTQIWIAVSVYVLVAIIKKRLRIEASLYTILQILSPAMFERMLFNQLVSDSGYTSTESETADQLNIFREYPGH